MAIDDNPLDSTVRRGFYGSIKYHIGIDEIIKYYIIVDKDDCHILVKNDNNDNDDYDSSKHYKLHNIGDNIGEQEVLFYSSKAVALKFASRCSDLKVVRVRPLYKIMNWNQYDFETANNQELRLGCTYAIKNVKEERIRSRKKFGRPPRTLREFIRDFIMLGDWKKIDK